MEDEAKEDRKETVEVIAYMIAAALIVFVFSI